MSKIGQAVFEAQEKEDQSLGFRIEDMGNIKLNWSSPIQSKCKFFNNRNEDENIYGNNQYSKEPT